MPPRPPAEWPFACPLGLGFGIGRGKSFKITENRPENMRQIDKQTLVHIHSKTKSIDTLINLALRLL